MNKPLIDLMAFGYQKILKPTFFAFTTPESIHDRMTRLGESIGKIPLAENTFQKIFTADYPALEYTINGITFKTPVGLAAGFDYEARLTQILPKIGFGFQSIGTITLQPYQGNPSPMLGRLPKSKSLMVNKGFKNFGVPYYIEKLKNLNFNIPLGISIGRSNTNQNMTQNQAIEEIIKSFTLIEEAQLNHTYYELNISCPNLYGDVSFYPPKNLNELLNEIDKLKLKKLLWIKMPIEKTDQELLDMTEVIVNHDVQAIIIGNLQKNRQDPSLDQKEVSQFEKGNFSGKATWNRSNQLIETIYRVYKRQITIIGCGGVFNAHDAYTKIKLGASLIQMVTGLIFQGPQVVAQINYGLDKLIQKDGFLHISEAVGTGNKHL